MNIYPYCYMPEARQRDLHERADRRLAEVRARNSVDRERRAHTPCGTGRQVQVPGKGLIVYLAQARKEICIERADELTCIADNGEVYCMRTGRRLWGGSPIRNGPRISAEGIDQIESWFHVAQTEGSTL